MKPVAVLGAGPAGLMAAHGLAMTGVPVAVISQPDRTGSPLKSMLGGAQFLHEPIPMVNEPEPDVMVTYKVSGDTETYKEKVYGDDPTIPFVSMQGLVDGKQQAAWNLQRTYDALWDNFEHSIANNLRTVNGPYIIEAIQKGWFSAIVSTVPTPALCLAAAGMIPEQHMFVSQTIKIANHCILGCTSGDNVVIYDGTRDHTWYRCSMLFGHGSTEWSTVGKTPPGMDLVTARKPLRTTCTCHQHTVARMGRNGTWTKGVLTHHAFVEAVKMGKEMMG